MISKFIQSRFSGYIAVIGVAVILALVWYIFNEGKKSCKNSVANEQVLNTINVEKDASHVKKEEQSMDQVTLDKSLCDLGIVRQNRGCQ